MEIFDAETRLVAFVAQRLALETDRRVFREKLPPGVREGVAVKFLSRENELAGSAADCVAEVVLEFFTRSELLALTERLAAALPDYGGDFKSLLPNGGFDFSEKHDGGLIIHRARCRIVASFA